MSQKSILSFFQKGNTNGSQAKADNSVLKRNRNAAENSLNCSESDGETPKRKKPKAVAEENVDINYAVGDIVWAKLEGYDWWPAIVYDHPKKKVHFRGGNRHDRREFNVQFFDNPVTRGWVFEKNMAKFNGTKSGEAKIGSRFRSNKPGWIKAVAQADNAIEMVVAERLELAVCDATSDEENLIEMNAETENQESETSPTRTRTRQKKRRVVLMSDDEDDNSSAAASGDEEDAAVASEASEESEEEVKSKKSTRNAKQKAKLVSSTPKAHTQRKASDSSKGRNRKSLSKSLNITAESYQPDDSRNESAGSVSFQTKAMLSKFANDSSQLQDPNESTVKDVDFTEVEFEHMKLPFLQPDAIMDANKRRPTHEDYDPKTLYVPQSHLAKETPGIRLWWEFKSTNYDKIILYKVGKFYELYHMDAVIAVKELNLTFMRRSESSSRKYALAHCGFPEIAFGRFSDQLVQKGYKVARIEQTETPQMMEERVKHTKKDRIVRREVCRIITPGTKMYSYLDGDDRQSLSSYLLAVCERYSDEKSRYGVCFVDCAVGKIWVGEFDDDQYGSYLRTLVAQYPPVEILYPKRKLSAATETLLNTVNSAKLEPLTPKTEFWTTQATIDALVTNGYFIPEGSKTDNCSEWPNVLKDLMSDDSLRTCKKDFELCVSAFGAVIWYLNQCRIDFEVLSLKLFEKYDPQLQSVSECKLVEELPKLTCKTMVLDGITLKNLDVVQSSSKADSIEGTLFQRLDTCSSAFGRRLLRQWLCNPLCIINDIKDRQEAISDLRNLKPFAKTAETILKQLPDLERLLQKIHTIGSKKSDHPDSRAVLFEEEKYSKRKVSELLSTLDALHRAVELVKNFSAVQQSVRSKLLRRYLQFDDTPDGDFPDIREMLKKVEMKFDIGKARKDSIIIVTAGLENMNAAIEDAVKDFDKYLKKQREKLQCPILRYSTTSGKNRYRLEIPESIVSRVPDSYNFHSKIKGFRRYITNDLEKLIAQLEQAEKVRDDALADSMKLIFSAFANSNEVWRRVVACLANLDVLLALARYADNCEQFVCIPELTAASNTTTPFIEIVDGVHPCASKIYTTNGQFVPNDTTLGTDSNIMLLTGPNMGGKSTLMRQTGLLAILAQIGSYIPAQRCSLSPVDRIFTRLGASDKLSIGQSTFCVELMETKTMLESATAHSLVVIDELGRGTSTHDGTAVAYAVLKNLAGRRFGPRTLFSTHYHNLVNRFRECKNITLWHMACQVENETFDNPNEETITFLYKLVPQDCPKSYGFHAAKLAGISPDIVKNAMIIAREMEKTIEVAKKIRNSVVNASTMNDADLLKMIGGLVI